MEHKQINQKIETMKKSLLLSLALVLAGLNSSAQWELLQPPTPYSLSSVAFTDVDTGYVVGDYGTILKTTNGGTTWDDQFSETDQYLASVCFPEANAGFAIGNNGTILKTTNGGTSWDSLPSGTTANLTSVCFPEANTGYVIGDYGTILKTTDAGTSWDSLSSGTVINLASVFFIDTDTGYAIGTDGGGWFTYVTMLRTTDGGITWNDSSLWVYYVLTLNSVYFTDANIGYFAGGGYSEPGAFGTIMTTDGGITLDFQYISASAGMLNSVYFSDANTGYSVGEHGTILEKIEGETTWNIQPSLTYQNLNSVYFPDANTGYIVGDGGTILKTTNGGTVGVIEKRQANSLKIYPDPASEQITIELSESGSNMNGKVSIFGMTGQEMIKQEVKGSKLELNVSSLPTGIYFVRLIDEEMNVPISIGSGKFVKD